MNAPARSRPVVEDYWDYRKFLKDLIEHLRAEGKFSLRTFRAKSGMKSNTHISMIIDGRRNVTPKSLSNIVQGLGLSESEKQYLERLAELNQATTPEKRDQAYIKLIKHRRFLKIRKTAVEEYEFYSHWHRPVLVEALGNESFGRLSPKEMADALGLPEAEVKESIKSLLKIGYIEKVNDRLRRKDMFIQNASIVESIHVRNMHREMIKKALHAVDNLSKEERELTSMTISLGRKEFEAVRKKLFEVMQDIGSLYSEVENPESVYQLNLQFFPVLNLPKDKN